jgi:hypothetical protein
MTQIPKSKKGGQNRKRAQEEKRGKAEACAIVFAHNAEFKEIIKPF